MYQAHRIRLDPNNVQATYLARCAGTARFAYNWALAEWKRQHEACKLDPALPKPNEAALRRQLNAIKREMFPWMLEVTKNAPQMAIQQLGCGFKNFFEGRAGYPTFRRKGRDDRFTLTNDQFGVKDKHIRIRSWDGCACANPCVLLDESDLRAIWRQALILNRPGRDRDQVGADVASGLADIESYGSMVLANPDFVERIRAGAPLNGVDSATFLGGDARGYTDYPALAVPLAA